MKVKLEIFGVLDDVDNRDKRVSVIEVDRSFDLYIFSKAPCLVEDKSSLTFLMYLDYVISYDVCQPGSSLSIRIIGDYLECSHNGVRFKATLTSAFMSYLADCFSFDYEGEFKLCVSHLRLLTARIDQDTTLALRMEYIKRGTLLVSSDAIKESFHLPRSVHKTFGRKLFSLNKCRLMKELSTV